MNIMVTYENASILKQSLSTNSNENIRKSVSAGEFLKVVIYTSTEERTVNSNSNSVLNIGSLYTEIIICFIIKERNRIK